MGVKHNNAIQWMGGKHKEDRSRKGQRRSKERTKKEEVWYVRKTHWKDNGEKGWSNARARLMGFAESWKVVIGVRRRRQRNREMTSDQQWKEQEKRDQRKGNQEWWEKDKWREELCVELALWISINNAWQIKSRQLTFLTQQSVAKGSS